jgi:hypothetical protein
MSLAGGNLPLGRRDIESFPCPEVISMDAGRIDQKHLEQLLSDPSAPMPTDSSFLLAVLDAAYGLFTKCVDPVWDRIVQRAILRLAGCDEAESTALLALHDRRHPVG